jgi:DNA-binding MarR family transcriptional regulator
LNDLFAASIAMGENMTRGLEARGLTRTRATALWTMARHSPLTQREAADILRVTPRNVTKLVDALEHDGFVTREAHADDRRAVLLRLTPKGRAAAARMDTEADAFAQHLFGDLGADDLATLIRILTSVIDRVDQPAPPR